MKEKWFRLKKLNHFLLKNLFERIFCFDFWKNGYRL